MPVRMISADSHINEPPDLWTSRAPQSLADQVPRVVGLPEGDAWMLVPGGSTQVVGASAVAGRRPEDFAKPVFYREMRAGSFDPAARMEDQDIDGVVAEVLYPSPSTGGSLDLIPDPDVRQFCVQAYNDWITDYQNYDPKRLVGVGVLPPVEDGERAAGELVRAANLGLRSVLLTLGATPVSDPAGEAIWQAAAEHGVTIAMHIGGGGAARKQYAEATASGLPGTQEAALTMNTFTMASHIATLLFAGIPDRYPTLRFVIAESGIGWIPYLLERLDYVFDRHRQRLGSGIERRPSEIWAQQFAATFQEDHHGLALRDVIGISNMMWASDYPHSATTWPNSQKVIDEYFGDVPEGETHRIVYGNAAELYGL